MNPKNDKLDTQIFTQNYTADTNDVRIFDLGVASEETASTGNLRVYDSGCWPNDKLYSDV